MKLLVALSWLHLVSIKLKVPAGTKELRPPNSSSTFISTPSHSQLIAEMMQSHMVKDICLIGAKVVHIMYSIHTYSTHGEFLALITMFLYFLGLWQVSDCERVR